MTTRYTIPAFIEDAKAIVAGPGTLESRKSAIGERMELLCQRDDLTRTGHQVFGSDASNATYILWREPPFTALALGKFDPGYRSPIHEHGPHWVVGCCYRGQDRWDMYERMDDGSRPGFAQVKMVDQIVIPQGKSAWMPPPPRTIHSHNNEAQGLSLELIFSVVEPLPAGKRMIYDPDTDSCWPSPFDVRSTFSGDRYPPRPSVRASLSALTAASLTGIARGGRQFVRSCPICQIANVLTPRAAL